MVEVSKSDISTMISNKIRVPLQELCEALEKKDATRSKEPGEIGTFREVLSNSIAEAIVKAVGKGDAQEDMRLSSGSIHREHDDEGYISNP